MTDQLQEPRRQLPQPRPDDLDDGDLAVVIRDPAGNAPQEGKGPHVPVPERLGALPLIRPHEERVGIRQGHHEETDLPQHPAHLHQRVPEIHLRFPRRMRQGQEDFLTGPPNLPDRILDDRVAARESFLLQTLPDPLGGVTLLLMDVFVLLQDLANPIHLGVDLGLLRTLTPLIPGRRRGRRQNLLQRRPMPPRLSQNLTLADALAENSPANVQPLFHIAVHSLSFLLRPS